MVSDHIPGPPVSFAGPLGDFRATFTELLARLMGVVADGLGRMRDGRRAARGQFGEELLDRLTPLAGLPLDAADEFVDVAPLDLEVVVGQLPPALLHMAPQLVPLTLELLSVDRHRHRTPLFSWIGRPQGRL